MKIIPRKKWLSLVAQEIRAIKKNTTKEEKKKLHLKTFDPQNSSNCIYGLMTGECRSKRAVSLIEKCCKGVISNNTVAPSIGYMKELTSIEMLKKKKITHTDYFSNLEAYIYDAPSQLNKQILGWIKGTTKTFPILK